MENQVMDLKVKGIAAEHLSSSQTANLKKKIYEDLDSGKPYLRLLYVTPELLATSGFMLKLVKLHSRGLLCLIAIDEAHCISMWGHDFRPSYRKLSSLRNQFPSVPILALTATAVPKVQEDVVGSLCLRNPLILKSSFNRPNIYYEVRYKDLLDNPYSDICNYLRSYGSVCAIIYCLERATCDDLAVHLSNNGLSCAAYHAGLSSSMRSSVLENWISSKTQVVVATVAFGMGIDRKDVRVVCHFNVPKSMESFYQESGRAGRDQLPSCSVLYYGLDDRNKMEFILRKSSNKNPIVANWDENSKKALDDFHQMIEYCEQTDCRRKKILKCFGEEAPGSLCSKSCDACKFPNVVAKKLELLSTAFSCRKGSSRICINSASNFTNENQTSEFWNRDDEACTSEEDISDSDDCIEMPQNLPLSSTMSERMNVLQRAEENYYRNKNQQANKGNKGFISETLRESVRQKLLTTLKQNQHRFYNSKMDLVTLAGKMENECFQKYEKSGKSFYLSKMAITVRWLQSSSPADLNNLLCETSSVSSPGPAGSPASQISAGVTGKWETSMDRQHPSSKRQASNGPTRATEKRARS